MRPFKECHRRKQGQLSHPGEADEGRYFRASGHEYGRWPVLALARARPQIAARPLPKRRQHSLLGNARRLHPILHPGVEPAHRQFGTQQLAMISATAHNDKARRAPPKRVDDGLGPVDIDDLRPAPGARAPTRRQLGGSASAPGHPSGAEAKPLSQACIVLRGLCNEAVFASFAAEAQAPVVVADKAELSTTV